jgi:protein-tyrosine phosphatase
MSKVLPKIFLGSENEACDSKWLAENGINFVVNCAKEVKCKYPKNVEVLRLPLEDTSDMNITPYLEPAAKKIDEALAKGETILVHCQLGISRSASVLIYWLATRIFSGDLNKAIAFLKERRDIISPNFGFMVQLGNLLGMGKRERKKPVKYS